MKTLEPGDIDQQGNRYPDENSLEAQMDKLAYLLERDNIVYIKGVPYQLASYGEAYEDGSRHATLRVWKPF